MELENDKKRYDRTYAQIDLGAIRHNIAVERARVGADVKIWQSSKQMPMDMVILKWLRP